MPLGFRSRRLQTSELVERRRGWSFHPKLLVRPKGESQKNSCTRYCTFVQSVSARDREQVDGIGGCPRGD